MWWNTGFTSSYATIASFNHTLIFTIAFKTFGALHHNGVLRLFITVDLT